MTLAESPVKSPLTATAAAELIRRLLPDRVDEFRTELIAGDDELDTFEISGGGNQPVLLRGTTPLAIASGLNHYLKFFCNAHVSWCGDQLNLPAQLPEVSPAIRITTPHRYRYYFNYCTFSYSMAWWDWARWEREIDWMALAGINLPLAITGQEAVWQRVYKDLGLDDADLADFFPGPAFLAWGGMGNLDAWGGPLSQSWLDQQRDLQVKILRRQRELGMKPVLPAFTGHVPPAMVKKFPGAQIKQLHNWAEKFTGTFILDPLDPLFKQIAHAFIMKQKQMYGTDTFGAEQFYSCDTFNENTPPSNDPKYLARVSRALFDGMAETDPRAVWILQGWMFFFNPDDPGFWKMPQIHALLDAVPNDRMIVLDLHSEGKPLWQKTEAFCSKPWIWCFLHNFGGHRSMFGNINTLARDLPAAMADDNRGNMVGVGLTPEGIDQNPVMYDMMGDLMWRKDEPNVRQWLGQYLHRRYGKSTPALVRAWGVLRQTVYDRPTDWTGTVSTMVNLSPRLSSERAVLNYPPQKLIEAWELLAQESASLSSIDPFLYDLVDVSRQVLANHATAVHSKLVAAYYRRDKASLETYTTAFLTLLEDLDRLLATRKELLLGAWLEAAKAPATTDEERKRREWNARSQVTLWGDHDSMLRDYARKEWAGQIMDFYRPRWARFFKQLKTSLEKKEELDDKSLQTELRQWEEQWTRKTNLFAALPQGDAAHVSRELLAKYRPIFTRMYWPVDNLALNKPVSASAGTCVGHPAENAVTGIASRASYWSADTAPQWLVVDLQKAYEISAVQIFYFWDGSRSYKYTVETSLDEKSWSLPVDESQNESPATPQGAMHRIAPHLARYVRLTVLDNTANEAVHVLDLRVYSPANEPHGSEL